MVTRSLTGLRLLLRVMLTGMSQGCRAGHFHAAIACKRKAGFSLQLTVSRHCAHTAWGLLSARAEQTRAPCIRGSVVLWPFVGHTWLKHLRAGSDSPVPPLSRGALSCSEHSLAVCGWPHSEAKGLPKVRLRLSACCLPTWQGPTAPTPAAYLPSPA